MATSSLPLSAESQSNRAVEHDESIVVTIFRAVRMLASLRITVTLFAMAIFIILAGTLAQERQDIWEVVSQYFRTAIAWIEFQVFFPKAFFPKLPDIPGGFYFPGGWLIGTCLAINLAAAHLTRFMPSARGARLLVGMGVMALGAALTTAVVLGTRDEEGFEAMPWLDWGTMWLVIKFTLAGISVGGAWWAATFPPSSKLEARFLTGLSLVTGVITAWLFYQGSRAELSPSSMRILWQLIQGGLCGVVLLIGACLMYGKRGGVVTLHAGVALVMFSELLVGMQAKEAQMYLWEGQSSNYVEDSRVLELAVVSSASPGLDDHVVIPQALLKDGAKLTDPQLPVDIEVVKFFPNTTVRAAKADEESPVTAGRMKGEIAVEERPVAATEQNRENVGGIYVTLLKKGTSDKLGTWLLLRQHPLFPQPEPFEVDGKKYELALRFERNYKPYTVQLIDARDDKYLGTNTTKNFSSDIHLLDASRKVDRKIKIWMNNPLRFAGETFYQQSMEQSSGDPKWSSLQVVKNTGWMIPYVSCMIVAVGMLYQFSLALMRFLNRHFRPEPKPVEGKFKGQKPPMAASSAPATPLEKYTLPLVFVLFVVMFFGGLAKKPQSKPEDFDLTSFGQIPVVDGGRVKPLDSLARATLRMTLQRESAYLPDGEDKERKVPATRWLLDLISNNPTFHEYRVLKIDMQEVLDLFDLKRREGLRYSLKDIQPKMNEFQKQVQLALKVPGNERSPFQRNVLELAGHIHRIIVLQQAFMIPDVMDELPSVDEFEQDPQKMFPKLRRVIQGLQAFEQALESESVVLSVPVSKKDEEAEGLQKSTTSGEYDWKPYSLVLSQSIVKKMVGISPPAAVMSWAEMLNAYKANKPEEFNKQAAKYHTWLAANGKEEFQLERVKFEAFFNRFSPFFYASWVYLVAAVLCLASLMVMPRQFNRSAWAVIAVTFFVHTFAICGRMYISGRPPVTNLYSVAIFVGWGAVLLGLLIEVVFRMGVGNLLAAVVGFLTLQIAHYLANDGDTFTVLQAVLDTQFWLATHVVLEVFGYAATYVAGFLGLFYVLVGVTTPTLNSEMSKNLARMIYGCTCFALFLSFVGTVLGGLWGDDSWGRFWGWDPKENGALIIVLWNALVLHARWDNIVKDRGMAVLSIVGNIVVSWSFFGVNELNIGLHAYAKTEGRLMWLGLFVLSQLVVIGLGCLPKRMWRSFSKDSALEK